MTTEKDTGPNYLGLLAIGWCYILSAQLIEMQGGSAVLRYTDSLADCLGESPSSSSAEAYYINFGGVDERIARWWSAILAKREGWKAIVKDDPGNEFVAPWSVSRTCETHFLIKQRRDSLFPAQTAQIPLSSDEAFYALLEFAHLHDLESQVSIALTIAIPFPMHRYYGTHVKLPPPREHGGKIPSTIPDVSGDIDALWIILVARRSLQHEGKREEVLALIGAIRRPSVAALWIGAAVSGIGPKLLEKVRRGRPALDSIAFPWTGAPQSFMDDAGSGPYTWGDPAYISRPDVWRLLHLSPTEEDDLSYEYGPMTPWEPCGANLTTNCALRVTTLLKCPRHEYRYQHWSWELEGGETVQDYGFLKRYPSLLTSEPFNNPDSKVASHSLEKRELGTNREASEEASLEAFRWFVFGGEGLPPEKIYHDGLFQEIWEQDDDSVELGDADHRHSQETVFKHKDRVETWLDTID
ncbi:hypothetical protein BDV33DRAFT_199175 [Aspergillus novoparasiticus]|uniref:Uncharacterized protein n=1 Tax=Aspergillus novoparasiticus TaxID=986946 RepID=A0A5N6F4W7_9EURO|nr:hypothetical protein BDV33DRAFT_199175 [Aspergillus novoparasiticus]